MKKSEKVEIKIYELLGVNYFKKLVFKLEKLIHRKDKKTNINYHIKDCTSISSIEKFKKYLYYNGFIHVKNTLIGTVIISTMLIFNVSIIFLIPLILLLIKDLYCIMLQRYNWVRINDFEEKLKQREKKKILIAKEKILEENINEKLVNICKKTKIDKTEMIESLKGIKNYINDNSGIVRINKSIEAVSEIIFKEEDSKSLERKLK